MYSVRALNKEPGNRGRERGAEEPPVDSISSSTTASVLGTIRWLFHHQKPHTAGDKRQSPSPYGGRGALPSLGGSPSDLLFLAGGEFRPSSPTIRKMVQNRSGVAATALDNVVYLEEQPPAAFLNNLLLGQWEDRMSRGLFRYDVTSCETRIIPGNYGFIAQLNEGRHMKKRSTEFRVDRVLQPFDQNKFNFTKIGQEEVLFRFEQSKDNCAHYFPLSPVIPDSNSSNVVAINVSPIEYGHVLLIPRVLDCLPQRIDHDSFFLALHLAKEAADPFFRVGYNSLGAFATINHLHFQAYYLMAPFPVEKAPTQRIIRRGKLSNCGVMISKLLNYPVRGFVFEGGNSVQDLSQAVANSCIFLQNNNMPFNVLISDCGERVFLFPQCFAEKQALGEVRPELLETLVNPAVWEISGHMVLKRRKDYEDASEEYAWRLLAEVSLSEGRFHEVKDYVLEAAGLMKAEIEGNERERAEEDFSTPRATPTFA